MNTNEGILTSPLAGRWYEASPERLMREIENYLSEGAAAGEPLADVRAVLVPHAGYAYSARIAAAALQRADLSGIQRVIVMGPSHQVAMHNQASIPACAAVKTPLGSVELDQTVIKSLRWHPRFATYRQAHQREHSVQIQLPLLQRAIPHPFTLVPVVVGQLDLQSEVAMGAAIAPLLDAGTLLVVSSDFTHYGASFGYVPFSEDDLYEKLSKLDHQVFDAIASGDCRRFRSVIDETGATVCGRFPIGVMMAALPEDAVVREVAYDTSGRQTDDTTHSVSYLSAVVTV